MLLTGVCALSVHVVMLQVLHVPYPDGYPEDGLLIYVNTAFSVLAYIFFYSLARDKIAGLSPVPRCLLLFVLVAMLREQLIRLPIMDGVTTTAWIYSIVSRVPKLIGLLLISAAIVGAAPWMTRTVQKFIGALLISAFFFFVCRPLVEGGFKVILNSISYLNHAEVYTVPYGWQVEVPAYITFAEPVTACFIIMALVRDHLSAKAPVQVLQFALLFMLMRGLLFAPFIYACSSKMSAPAAILSMGQFSLEALTLALMTAIIWPFCQKPVPAGQKHS